MPNIDEEIQSAEKKLGFKIPPVYQDLLKTRAAELSSITIVINGRTSSWFDRVLALTPSHLEMTYYFAKEAFESANESLPDWWQSYFAIGDDGGDGFYFMKRDGSPEVYFVDDYVVDEEPTVHQPTLDAFIEQHIQDREKFISDP